MGGWRRGAEGQAKAELRPWGVKARLCGGNGVTWGRVDGFARPAMPWWDTCVGLKVLACASYL